ncbi:MAG: hypothetical protein ACLFOC_06965 [Campylobacterales bacterium]
MIRSNKIIKLQSAILSITECSNRIIVIDNAYSVFFIDAETFDLIKSIKLIKKDLVLHPYSKPFATSCYKQNIAIPLPNNPKISLIDISRTISKKAIFSLHEDTVVAVAFSHRGSLLCGLDNLGRGYVLDTNNHRIIYRLPARPDSGSVTCFSPKSNLLFAAYYDKTFFIHDVTSNKELFSGRSDSVIEDGRFLENEKFLFINRGGEIGFIDSFKSSPKMFKISDKWLISLAIVRDRYAIIGTKEGSILVFDIKSFDLILEVESRKVGITNITVKESRLWVGYIDGNIELFDYAEGVDSLVIHIDLKEYEKISELLERNNFLIICEEMERLEERFDEILRDCSALIAKGEEVKAIARAKPLFYNSEFKERFEELISQKDIVARLNKHYSATQYVPILVEADKTPWIKELDIYNEVYHSYKILYNKAKKMLFENYEDNQETVKKLLKPYMRVKSLNKEIVALLSNSQQLKMAESLVKEKKFRLYFNLTKKHTFLKDTTLYEKCIKIAEGLLQRTVQNLYEGNYKEAKDGLDFLSPIDEYKDVVKSIKKDMDMFIKFDEAINKDEIKEAFEIFEYNQQLRNRPLYSELIDKYMSIIDRSSEYVDSGNPIGAKKELDKLFDIDYCSNRVNQMMERCYINELQNKIKKSDIDTKQSIQNIIDIFGITEDIKKVIKSFNLSIDDFNISKQTNVNTFPDSIMSK